MIEVASNKSVVRHQLRKILTDISPSIRHQKSLSACGFLSASAEFKAARVIMLFLSTNLEIDTAPLALKAWQAGKTVVVPKVSWEQRRMLPMEIDSLQAGLEIGSGGIREPVGGKPMPIDFIDLVVVPGLGFTANGHRIGRGMGFYDRFLATPEFIGLSCGLGFEDQVLEQLPVLDHDVPLSMLVTDMAIRRLATNCIET